jgi:predicted DNA-binding transcriptional regulator AlpA
MTKLNVVNGASLREQMGLLTQEELAQMCDVQVATVRMWRVRGTGPQFTRLGKQAFYRRDDVAAWIEDNLTRQDREEVAA